MLISLIVSIGTIGYMTIEDWPLLDAFYMTMITLTTVGFKEIHDLSGGFPGAINEETHKLLLYNIYLLINYNFTVFIFIIIYNFSVFSIVN